MASRLRAACDMTELRAIGTVAIDQDDESSGLSDVGTSAETEDLIPEDDEHHRRERGERDVHPQVRPEEPSEGRHVTFRAQVREQGQKDGGDRGRDEEHGEAPSIGDVELRDVFKPGRLSRQNALTQDEGKGDQHVRSERGQPDRSKRPPRRCGTP